MKPCDALLECIEAAVSGDLDAELRDHLTGCTTCQMAVERARGLADGSSLLGRAKAPRALVAKLKTLPRLAPGCEQALLVIDSAFDGELEEHGRTALLDHLNACPRCRSTWEACATLREVGSSTVAPGHLRARLVQHPSRRRPVGRSRHFFDLRLATAAAYLLAAVSILVAGNPASLARASSERFDQASLYARAAMENRLEACTGAALDEIDTVRAWVADHAVAAWQKVQGVLGKEKANRAAAANVVEDGNGG